MFGLKKNLTELMILLFNLIKKNLMNWLKDGQEDNIRLMQFNYLSYYA